MIRLFSPYLKNHLNFNKSCFFKHQNILRYFNAKVDFSKDYFKVLEVNENSTPEEIKKSYYKLVKQYHPDVNKDNAEYFKLINEAYEVLSNEQSKNEYISMRANPFQNSSTNYSQSYEQQNYGQYYQYGNRKNQKYDYKRYEQQYHSTADAQRQTQGDFYNSNFSKSQFYQEMQNPYSSQNNYDFEPSMSAEEKMRLTKKKLIAFTFVILGFYLIFDVMVMKLLNSSEQYVVYDPETGQRFITDAQTLNQLKRRGYDASFISPTDRDLQNRYGNRNQDERYNYQRGFNYDTKREKI
ncbi:hypothetical protein ABPG72_014199 [Tetrahymena utriculariae]